MLDILYEDNHLLAVNKPAGLPTMGTPGDRATLLTLARLSVKQRYGKPGNVYLGVVSRLDAPVSGVVLLARTSKAARRLAEQFRTRGVEKTYWALVEGRVAPAEAECVDWLVHDERHRRVHAARPDAPGAREARLRYRTLRAGQDESWLEIELLTGRKHQIRVQLARRDHPILGDRKYGSRRPFGSGIALHARRLVVSHPIGGAAVTLEAPVPAAWHAHGVVG
jgi:23S rRNA pseudouridine1911/1915/1917 synthase